MRYDMGSTRSWSYCVCISNQKPSRDVDNSCVSWVLKLVRNVICPIQVQWGFCLVSVEENETSRKFSRVFLKTIFVLSAHNTRLSYYLARTKHHHQKTWREKTACRKSTCVAIIIDIFVTYVLKNMKCLKVQ